MLLDKYSDFPNLHSSVNCNKFSSSISDEQNGEKKKKKENAFKLHYFAQIIKINWTHLVSLDFPQKHSNILSTAWKFARSVLK